jgi:sulfonate transport system substrate-binding protein
METIDKAKSMTVQWMVLLAASAIAVGARAEGPLVKSSAVAPSVPSKVRLAHVPLNDVTAIAAQKGWLQEEFAKYNAKADLVVTSSYGSSGSVAALFDRGDLHFVPLMMNMSLQFRAQGLDTVVVWGSTPVNPRRAATIVLDDSTIHSVAELKGKTLASSVLGCPYYASMEALRNQGVTVDNDLRKGDVRFINISGIAATSAFLAGSFQAYAMHPASATTASLYIQKQARELTEAVPNGVYVNSGGRSMHFASRVWANENPDLVRAYLTAWDRTVRWIAADHGAHMEEAATITARALRLPKAVALFDIKDPSTVAWNWGETDYNALVAAMKRYQAYQISVGDPFFTKFHLNDKQIEALVDKRFFAGGEYFVDVSESRQHSASAEPAAKVPAGKKIALLSASSR